MALDRMVRMPMTSRAAHVKMKIAEEKNQPHAFERSMPEGVFPDQVPSRVEQTFHEHAEDRVPDGPEPPVGEAQDFFVAVF